MEEAIGDLHARFGLMLMGLLVAMSVIGLLIMRNEEAEDGR